MQVNNQNEPQNRVSPRRQAVTEVNSFAHHQRYGNLGSDFTPQALEKVVQDSGIGHYTVEQVISKADPDDYRQELARLAYVLKMEPGEAGSEESPTKQIQ